MAIETETREPDQLEVDVPNEKTTPLYRDFIHLDHKLLWLVVSGAAWGFYVWAAHPMLIWIFASGVAITALNFVFFWIPFFDAFRTSLSAWLYRTGTHKWREMRSQTSGPTEDYERGHIAIHAPPEAMEREPIPDPVIRKAWTKRRVGMPRGIGKTSFYPTDVDQPYPMGWALHEDIWTATTRTEWYPWSPSLVRHQQARLFSLGRLANMLADNANGIVRLALQDRTVIGEHFQPELDMEPFIQKNLLRRSSSVESKGDLSELAIEMAAMGVKHYSSITVAIKKRWRGKEVPDGALRDYDAFVRGALSRSIGIQQLWPLTHNQLVFEFMLATDPVFVNQNWELLQQWVARKELLDPGIINPPTWEEKLKTYRFGETCHCGYIVENYGDDGKMPPDELWRIVGVPVPKTVTTVIEIVPMSIAKYLTTRSTTAVAGRNEEKARGSRGVNEFDKIELERRQAHERALARGRGMQSRSHTYVDFTAATEEEASANATAVASSVRHADPPFRGVLLRPLTGTQADNLGAAAPLALGLRSGTGETLKSLLQSDSSAE